jgi:hypothetical protein
MAAYLYFQFDSTDIAGSPNSWSLNLSNQSTGTGGTIVVWSVSELLAATTFTFDTATVEDLGGGLFRYRATYDVAEGYDLNDISQGYPSQLFNYIDIFVGVQLFDSSVTPPADLTICTECRQSNQQACGDTYFIEAGLTSGDTYYAAITDRNNDVYIQAIIADANGNLTIDALAPEFPVGFWLAESGNKSITVYEDEEMTIVSELTVGVNVYTCMILSLQYMYTTTSGLIPDFAFYVSDTLDYYVDNSSNTYIA